MEEEEEDDDLLAELEAELQSDVVDGEIENKENGARETEDPAREIVNSSVRKNENTLSTALPKKEPLRDPSQLSAEDFVAIQVEYRFIFFLSFHSSSC